MDAFLHIEDGVHYLAIMIIHGITDTRCEPWQSTKFAARVQAASVSGKPVLLRIDYEAGHGAGSTIALDFLTPLINKLHSQLFNLQL
ncbi:prolyl oligopeptidase family serine peptidase [Scytonema sp. UIC 10036]|uniref:prolyl oligopeptidase family serine peptidase n=1 Tax=Scytonema sp. UIC 10036 TaxID=2304196 RepID=UPI0012DA2F26|nr:prolyl oligopeptidase family serine peptidase [Scytonema sp. UIC 10036]MUG93744.1 prolyl oligopeptidase family serine peptidase [Scytonema sp. UIC 10036]